jgi:hemerythrin-like domain-containing protein
MNPFNSPSAGFDHPLEILDGCHQRILRFSDLVVRIARQVEASGVDDEVREAARSVIRYFDDAGAKHHRDEEEDLFPALGRAATGDDRTAFDTLVGRLRADHRQLDSLWTAMREHLQSMVDGREHHLDATSAEAFAAAYERHIEVEERELLPLAQRVLDRHAIHALGRSMAQRRGVATPKGS